MGTIAEHAKLARAFNLTLTALAPVMGALAMGEHTLWRLAALFMLGAGAHVFGFVLNDYMDTRIDRLSVELGERPLVSGSITPRGALAFALSGLAVMMVLGIFLVGLSFWPVVVLLMAAGFATLYNMMSKDAPGMDFLVAGAVGFLCLFGALSVSLDIGPMAVVTATLAFLQVMFMNVVAGGLKDIDHDSAGGGRTLAVAYGCRVIGRARRLVVPVRFKCLAHFLEGTFLFFIFMPFFTGLLRPMVWQVPVLVVLGVVMVSMSTRFMAFRTFDRPLMRKALLTHYIINFTLAPIMLSAMDIWAIVIIVAYPLGVAVSNLALHGGVAKAGTM